MTDLPTDIRQVSVNRVTLGVILSTAVLAGSISWSSSRLVARLDAVEATVEAIQDSMDMRPFARVEDVTEDIEDCRKRTFTTLTVTCQIEWTIRRPT